MCAMASSVKPLIVPGEQYKDRSWSLPLPLDQESYCGVEQSHIRHDQQFSQQLYLYSFNKTHQNRASGIITQAIANDDANTVSLHRILHKSLPTADDGSTRVCIDEVSRKLYLSFRGLKEDRNGHKCYQLAVMDLAFGQPDTFGYRRVTVEGKCEMYKISPSEKIREIRRMDLFVHPNTGKLLFSLFEEPTQTNLESRHPTDRRMLGILNKNAGRKHSIEAEILLKVATGIVRPDGAAFLNQSKGLLVFNWPQFCCEDNNCGKTIDEGENRSVVHIYSIDSEQRLEMKRQLRFDEDSLIQRLYPTDLLSKLKSDFGVLFSQRLCSMTSLDTRIFKYTAFGCCAGLGLVKRFERWISDSGCKTSVRRMFLEFDGLFTKSDETKSQTFSLTSIVGSMVYYELKSEAQRTVFRLDLNTSLKDYRKCFHCKTIETGKRRNVDGKRIAAFKVCRECKKLNLHRQWWKFECHFCSNKCVKEGWKEHKKIHRLGKIHMIIENSIID